MSNYDVLVNDRSLNIVNLINEKLIFFGERHVHSGDTNVIKKIIKVTEPDYVLVEGLGDLILQTKTNKIKASRIKEDDLFQGGLTKWWIDIALEFEDIPFIGFELTDQDDLKDATLAKKFKARENHWIKIIKRYATSNAHVLVICGDTHLRTISTKELGDPSPLYKSFPNAVFIRSPNPEIN